MFSSLPKLADKNFVIGFLMPAVLASLAALYLMEDTEPFRSILAAVLKDSDWNKITLLALAIWLLAILLLLCNHWMYRALEGYEGPFKHMGWEDGQRERMSAAQDRLAELQEAASAANASDEAKAANATALRTFLEDFPNETRLVLPTRFGNVIRAFEAYSLHVYGVDSIPTWLRLQDVMSKDFRALVEDTRARVDFSVNATFLAIGVAVLAAVRCGLNLYDIHRAQGGLTDVVILFPITAVLAVLVACSAYDSAIAQARAWGGAVKSAFDLYLPSLAAKLGYRLPATSAERRQFWEAVTGMFLHWTALAAESWPIASLKKNGAADKDGGSGDDEES